MNPVLKEYKVLPVWLVKLVLRVLQVFVVLLVSPEKQEFKA